MFYFPSLIKIMMSSEKLGNHNVEIEGVRHIGDHESVVYVRHIDDNADDVLKVTGKRYQPVRQSSQKHVLFPGIEAEIEDKVSSDLSDGEVKDNINNNNTCQIKEIKTKLTQGKSADGKKLTTKNSKKKATQMVKADKVKDQKKTKDIAKSLELYGLSPRIARKHQQFALHNKDPEAQNHGVNKHHIHHLHHTVTNSVESLGLSPGIKRKGAVSSSVNTHHHIPMRALLPHSLRSHSMDTLNHSSHSSSSEPSPMQSPNLRDSRKMSIPPVPLHSGIIGTDEELEKLRFIKKALTPDPFLPDILRKISNAPSYHLKPPVAAGGRRRSVSLDPMDLKYRQARDSIKKRIDSAHK